jgi:hypothetical protein
MAQVNATGRPVGVLDDGAVIGQITRETVLARLLQPQGR